MEEVCGVSWCWSGGRSVVAAEGVFGAGLDEPEEVLDLGFGEVGGGAGAGGVVRAVGLPVGVGCVQ